VHVHFVSKSTNKKLSKLKGTDDILIQCAKMSMAGQSCVGSRFFERQQLMGMDQIEPGNDQVTKFAKIKGDIAKLKSKNLPIHATLCAEKNPIKGKPVRKAGTQSHGSNVVETQPGPPDRRR
jgi:hypothetical protein